MLSAEPAFPADNKTIYQILKHWDVLLNYEESKSCKLYAIGENMAALEGRNYLKLPLENEVCMSFFGGYRDELAKNIDRDTSRFILRLKLIEQRSKAKYFIEQTEFFAGYPVIEVGMKGMKPYITSLIKFMLNGIDMPADIQSKTLTPQHIESIQNSQGELLIKKLKTEPGETLSEICFTDTNLLEEVIGVNSDNIQHFVKTLNREQQNATLLTADMLSGLFENASLKSKPEEDLNGLCRKLNQLFAHETEYRLRFFPYGLIWFADAGQPTYSLRRDMRTIVQDKKLEEMDEDHAFIRFFKGRSTAKSKPKTIVISADGQPPTDSQKMVLEGYSSSTLNVVEGPPGTGKTKVIRDLIVSRLIALCKALETDDIPENSPSFATLITSTNNVAVDHALRVCDFSAEPTLLPCIIRLGNRKILRSETFPFLEAYANRLREFDLFESRQAFKDALAQFEKIETAEDMPHGELLTLIFRTLTLWVIQNQTPALKLIGKILEELEESSNIRCLYHTKNRELFSMMFPVIGTTLLSVNNTFPLRKSLWGLTVVDEAGQCPPPNIVSVLYRTQSLILFGDIHQLEPIYTVAPDEYHKLKALRDNKLPDAVCDMFIPLEGSRVSLQNIAQKASHKFLSLTEHFRCRKEIIEFCASMCHYRLNVVTRNTESTALGEAPFYFLPVRCNEEPYSGSWLNAGEAQSVVDTFLHLIHLGVYPEDIVALTPFRGQMNFLLHKLRTVFSANRRLLPKVNMDRVTVATAHRFQGGERKIIIFSPVTHQKEPDFLNSRLNILNVSVSRAREHFILVGSPENMKRGKYTLMLMQHIDQHGQELILPQTTLNIHT